MRTPLNNVDLNLDRPGRGRVYNNITETIGNTPLVRLNRIAEEAGAKAQVLAKLEFFNPMSSTKDRSGVAMIADMEAQGLLTPSSVIVEPTSGNAGIGLAFACAAKRYRCIITMPDHPYLYDRQKMLTMLGAEVVLTPAARGVLGAKQKADELCASMESAVQPGQFTNLANAEIHKRTTAEEVWFDTRGEVDAVVVCVGSGGTLAGMMAALKPRKPGIKICAVEPKESPVLSGGKYRPHAILGIGANFVPEIIDVKAIDEILTVKASESVAMAKKLAAMEGIPCGISGGAAVAASLRLAARRDMAGKTIVTVVADFAERYLSTILFA